MQNEKTKNIARLGVLAALSVVLVYLIHFPIIPSAPFLEYDPDAVPILLGTFAMGPFYGMILTVVTCVIQGLTVSATSGWYGIAMHIIPTGTYVVVAGLIYWKNRTKKGAVIAMLLGIAAWVLVMIPANLFVTASYMGAPREVIAAMLPTAIIPFNLIKSGVNSVITFLLYKRISNLLH
jgi:riboflavin transporter FmnP